MKWVVEVKKRMDEGSCPIARGSGFHRTLMCDNCGLVTTRRDWAGRTQNFGLWWDYIKLHAIEEIRRISTAKRKSQSVQTYESDGA